MSKLLLSLFALILFGACTTNRLLNSEKEFNYSLSEQKIYILTALPIQFAQEDAQYLSTIILTSKKNNRFQLNAFTQFNKMNHEVISKDHFFVDSLADFGRVRFPLFFSDGKDVENFTFQLERESIEFKAREVKTKTPEFYSLSFEKRKFSLIDSNQFLLNFEPFSANLKTKNSQVETFFSLRILDQPDYLFNREPNSHFCFIELNLFPSLRYCFYCKVLPNGSYEVLYSDFNGEYVFENQFIEFSVNESSTFSINLKSETFSEPYLIQTNDIRNKQLEVIGNYLIYQL